MSPGVVTDHAASHPEAIAGRASTKLLTGLRLGTRCMCLPLLERQSPAGQKLWAYRWSTFMAHITVSDTRTPRG